MQRAPKRQRGQGMTEYIIIVAVVAILSIGIMTKFGDQLRSLFKTSAEQIAGDEDARQGNKASDEQDDRALSDISE